MILKNLYHGVIICQLKASIFILQVYSVVDEMFLAGEIRETSQTKVLKQLLMLSSLEWSDNIRCESDTVVTSCTWNADLDFMSYVHIPNI